MKYIKKFNQHSLYEAFIVGAEFVKPNLSLCVQEDEVHYTQYLPEQPKFLDILYSDANGNLSFTSEVLPVSEGKTPIALCIAGTGFFGANEKARWMSLKYMNYTTPDTGSLMSQGIYWGNYGTDISTITNIQYTHINSNNFSYGRLLVDYFDNNNSSVQNKIPSLFDENNNWNISVLGTINIYATTDIDGINKTNKILDTVTAQSTWQIDTSITNNSAANYAPAACCCARYYTLGTQTGDWYLGAVGEMSIILAKKTDINIKLASINTIYPNDCINLLINDFYWTSSEYNNNKSYDIGLEKGIISDYQKNSNFIVVAMLQY